MLKSFFFILKYCSMILSCCSFAYLIAENGRYEILSSYLSTNSILVLLFIPVVAVVYNFFRLPGQKLTFCEKLLLFPAFLLQLLGFSTISYRLLDCELGLKDWVIKPNAYFSIRRLWSPEELLERAIPSTSSPLPSAEDLITIAKKFSPSAEQFQKNFQWEIDSVFLRGIARDLELLGHAADAVAAKTHSIFDRMIGAVAHAADQHPFIFSAAIILGSLLFIGWLTAGFPEKVPDEKLRATVNATAQSTLENEAMIQSLGQHVRTEIADLNAKVEVCQELTRSLSNELATSEPFVARTAENVLKIMKKMTFHDKLIRHQQKTLEIHQNAIEATVLKLQGMMDCLKPVMGYSLPGIEIAGGLLIKELLDLLIEELPGGADAVGELIKKLPPGNQEIYAKFLRSATEETVNELEAVIKRRSSPLPEPEPDHPTGFEGKQEVED